MTVGRESKIVDARGVASKRFQFLIRRGIPESNGLVLRRGGDQAAVGTESDARRIARMAKAGDAFTRGDVPQPHRPILARRGQSHTIRADRDLGAGFREAGANAPRPILPTP